MSMNPIDFVTKVRKNINRQKMSFQTKEHSISFSGTVDPMNALESTQKKRVEQRRIFEYNKQYNDIRLPHRRCE